MAHELMEVSVLPIHGTGPFATVYPVHAVGDISMAASAPFAPPQSFWRGRALRRPRMARRARSPPNTMVIDAAMSRAQLAQALCRETLSTQPGWRDGRGVAVGQLRRLIVDWDAARVEPWLPKEADVEDEFRGAVEALAAAGWLRISINSLPDDDVLYTDFGPMTQTKAMEIGTSIE